MKEIKQLKADLDAANKEVRQVMNDLIRVEAENKNLKNQNTLLNWQIEMVRLALSKQVVA